MTDGVLDERLDRWRIYMSNQVDLQDWVGRTEERHDRIDPTPVLAMARTLDDRDFKVRAGDPLPELWHWLYFLPMAAQFEIGADGHPKKGGFLPPVALERRMWASSRLTFHQDLMIGDEVHKTSEILKISEKQGKTGGMVFVTVRHLTYSTQGLAITEEQDIVYLPMPKSFTPPPPALAPETLQWREDYPVSPVLLFRFSALTFNAHRIHYDVNYATEVEKYPGLVVHGPLQAILLMESAKQHYPDRKPAAYTFRAMRPLFVFDQIAVCGQTKSDGDLELYTANGDGHIGMQANLNWRS
ncbi:MAG: MaoC family dehydratase N-terminal domain-containing protein [Candidatus Contendobacter sp.]|nr:MaoC family dehydratase N-terminal domain-containing protein [Candidatus Contendobacter sp.]